jgi:hypothetical protein
MKHRRNTLADSQYESIRLKVVALSRDDSQNAPVIAAWQAAHDMPHETIHDLDKRDRALYSVAIKYRLLEGL